MADLSKEKAKKHQVLRRIKYKSGTPGAEYIDPDPKRDWKKDGPTFEHLDDGGYALLVARRFIAVATEGNS